MRIPFRSVVLTTATLSSLAFLTACNKAPEGGGGFPPPMVTYLPIATQDVPVDFEFNGQAAGSREVEIRARVNAIVEKRLFEEGSIVKAGQALFQLDSASFAAIASGAEAGVAQAEAQLKQAERNHARIKPLFEAKMASQKDMDDATSALELARAGLKAAQANLRMTRVDLQHTEVRAPITGVIGKAQKVEGALVNPQGDNLLATMAQTDPIDIQFSLSEQERNHLQHAAEDGITLPDGGFKVKLKTSDGKALAQQGKINFTDYRADASTGTFASKAVLPNPNGTIAPGQFVKVVLTGAQRKAAVAIPQRAVLDGPTGKYVYTVGAGQDGKPAALPRPVQVGEWVKLPGQDQNGWIIRQGLNQGDKVIIDGMARIFMPGQPVVPMTAEEAAKAAEAMAKGGAAAASKH